MGCGPAPLGRGDDLGPLFRLSGPVDPTVQVSGTRTRGAVAWAWLVDGVVDGVVEEVPFEPLVYRYALDVLPPPEPTSGTSPEPTGLGSPDLSLLVGWPVLIEPREDAMPPVAVDAGALLDWVAGTRADPTGIVTPGDGARLAAGTGVHVLVLLAADDPDVGRLATAPSWEPGSELCRLDGVVTGLTLYRDVGPGCFGWEPLAPAGERTEFQGIGMAPP